MNVLDLFSGIGGFSLGLERAGMRTVAFCEIEPFCRAVLRKHWPNVPIYEDVRTLTAERLEADGIRVDVICGGFPCQDISFAGKGEGIEGSRSGLWSEYARIIGEVRPRYVIVENVAALLGRGLDRVLGDLAALGFDAEWHCIPASAVGAPHRRDRVWLVANASKRRCGGEDGGEIQQQRRAETFCGSQNVGHPNGAERGALNSPYGQALADAPSLHGDGSTIHEGVSPEGTGQDAALWKLGGSGGDLSNASSANVEGQWLASRIQAQRNSIGSASWWLTEPDVGRVAHGVPSRVDRLKGLGNAVVPQIPEIIGRAIMETLNARLTVWK